MHIDGRMHGPCNNKNNDPIFPKKPGSRVVYIIIVYKNASAYVYFYVIIIRSRSVRSPWTIFGRASRIELVAEHNRLLKAMCARINNYILRVLSVSYVPMPVDGEILREPPGRDGKIFECCAACIR